MITTYKTPQTDRFLHKHQSALWPARYVHFPKKDLILLYWTKLLAMRTHIWQEIVSEMYDPSLLKLIKMFEVCSI